MYGAQTTSTVSEQLCPTNGSAEHQHQIADLHAMASVLVSSVSGMAPSNQAACGHAHHAHATLEPTR